MQPVYIHPPRFIAAFFILLCLDTLHCQVDQGRWGITHDINRLLSDADASLYRREETPQNSFNGTFLTNLTSGKNATSYWHLSADAPLLEQPAADVSYRPILTKLIPNHQYNPGILLPPCAWLQVFQLQPSNEFIIYISSGLLFGSLSCVWIILICSKRWNERIQPPRGTFAVKCSLILGLNVHATVCTLVFLLLQTLSKGIVSFADLSPGQGSDFCNVAISVLDICTSVFWILIGFSNTLLIVLLRALKPGVSRTEPLARLFRNKRNSVLLSLLAHCIPWICGIALNTLQLVFLHETTREISVSHKRSQLLRALISALPVLFAIFTLGTRLWRFQGHRLHLPSLSRVAVSYSCQHELSSTQRTQLNNTPSITDPSSSGIGETAVALFSSTIVTGLHLTCSLLAAFATCSWIASIALDEAYVLLRIYSVAMYFAISLFFVVTMAGYSSRLMLASAITKRNSYIPGEIGPVYEGHVRLSLADSELSPRELLEIPKFTRTQFFDTLSELPEHEKIGQCVASKAVEVIAVYEPIVS